MHIPLRPLSIFTMMLCLLGPGLDSPRVNAEEVRPWWNSNLVNQDFSARFSLPLFTYPPWRLSGSMTHSLQGRLRGQIWMMLRPQGQMMSRGRYEIIVNGMTTDPIPLILFGRSFFEYVITLSRYGQSSLAVNYGMNLYGEAYYHDQVRIMAGNESVMVRWTEMPDGTVMANGQSQLSLAGMLETAQTQYIFQGYQSTGARMTIYPHGIDNIISNIQS